MKTNEERIAILEAKIERVSADRGHQIALVVIVGLLQIISNNVWRLVWKN